MTDTESTLRLLLEEADIDAFAAQRGDCDYKDHAALVSAALDRKIAERTNRFERRRLNELRRRMGLSDGASCPREFLDAMDAMVL